MAKKKNKNTLHHLIAKSRGGTNDKANKKRCAVKVHEAFNVLFNNFYLNTEFVILFLQKFGMKNFLECRSNKRKKDIKKIWEKLFGSYESEKIVQILQTSEKKGLFEKRRFQDKQYFIQLWDRLFRLALMPDEITLLLRTYGAEIFLRKSRSKDALKTLGFNGLNCNQIIQKIEKNWS